MLHDGLDMISMKMPEKNHLEEAVHDGFDSLVESLSDRDELGSIIHDGLHNLGEQIGSKSDVSQVPFAHNIFDQSKIDSYLQDYFYYQKQLNF